MLIYGDTLESQGFSFFTEVKISTTTMKIGVVTFWQGNDNYGMILQCWALQQFLKSQGHEPYVIRYDTKGSFVKRLVKFFFACIKFIGSADFRKDFKNEWKYKKYKLEKDKLRDFDGFRRKNIVFSPLTYHYIEKLRLFPPKADCYISGSDQIWRGSLRYENIKGYFLDFGSQDVRRVAYAPSFGMSTYIKGEINLLCDALKKYDAISCREHDGVKICKEAGYNAVKVEDPTLLLDVDLYRSICKPVDYNNYLFIYSLNINSPEDIYWQDLKSSIGYKKVIVTPASGYFPGREIFGDEVIYDYATPGRWLSLIANADLVVTSSFHGVVFAIIFNVKFAFVPLKGEKASANNRVIDLLNSLELDFTVVENGISYKKLMTKDFSWNKVNNKKTELVLESFLYFQQSLLKS